MRIRNKITPLVFAVTAMIPQNVSKSTYMTPVIDTFEKVCVAEPPKALDGLSKAKELVKTFEFKNDTNFVGGVTKTYSAEDISKLKKTIKRPTTVDDYALPIANSKDVYLEPFGMFFAKRPAGRPHLGLDIFVSKYARKPKEPVAITAPIDGVVVSNKHANPDDNIVANCVGMIGVDGRKYLFDHLARETDYKKSVKMPDVGKIMHKGDTIGYVGSTGETSLWHLHLCVESEEQLAKQKKSKMWQDVSKMSQYSRLRGQCDPLNEHESGFIAKRLNGYRKQNMQLQDKLLMDYPDRYYCK